MKTIYLTSMYCKDLCVGVYEYEGVAGTHETSESAFVKNKYIYATNKLKINIYIYK